MQLLHVETIRPGNEAYLTNITDIDLIALPGGGQALYTLTGGSGGINAFSLGAQGDLTLLNQRSHLLYNPVGASWTLEWLGTPAQLSAVVAIGSSDALATYALAGNGGLGGRETLALSQLGSGVLAQTASGNGMLVTMQASGSNDLAVYRINGDGGLSLLRSNRAGTDTTTYSLFADAPVAGARGLIALSQAQDSITAFTLADNGTLTQVGRIGAAEGLGIADPSALSVVRVGLRDFVIVGSAGSGSLTVLELMADSRLELRDHVLDERNSRFAGVQAVEAITVDGWTYVLAGGSDDGVSLFVMMPDGRLQPLQHLAQQTGMALSDVQAIALAITGATGARQLQAYVAGEDEAAISRLSMNLAAQGTTLTADLTGGTLTGGASDDILFGRSGNDVLLGGGGDDFLQDGSGTDRLTGGAGADTFIFVADGATDTVTDFEVGRDSLDFSRMGRIYSAAQFVITETATGARVLYGDDLLILNSSTGRTITAAQIEAAMVLASRASLTLGPIDTGGGDGETDSGTDCPPHAPATPQEPSGGPGSLRLGTSGDDRVNGTSGDDTLDGGAGADTFNGRGGIDTVSYASATRRIVVDLQNDALTVGDAVGDLFYNIERFEGGARNDQLRGDDGANHFSGGASSDRLYGRAGDDSLFGEQGVDALYGNLGQDRMTGGGDPAQTDRFIYFQYSDSPACPHERDIITDFVSGVDRIEISRLDADLTQGRNQAFSFIGPRAFSGHAGELRYETAGAYTLVQADSDGDGRADFEIELSGVVRLQAGDFLL